MILDTLANEARRRVSELKKQKSLDVIIREAEVLPKGDFAFEKALRQKDVAFITEVKKASPSKGLITKNFNYAKIAKEYEAAGAAAISVLTEPAYFLGRDQYLKDIRQTVKIPIIRKDFTVDEYQIYEAKILGADAVLLICALLDTKTIERYLAICDKLGLSALVEAHDDDEIKSALVAGARVIGVNNRNLKDFTVDLENSINLRALVPKEIVFVSESGIKTPEDISVLRANGTDAVLIGETLMRSGDIAGEIRRLRGEAGET